MPSEFQFNPQHGELGPFQQVDVRVVFSPLTCRRVRSVLQCDVLGNQPRFDNGISSHSTKAKWRNQKIRVTARTNHKDEANACIKLPSQSLQI